MIAPFDRWYWRLAALVVGPVLLPIFAALLLGALVLWLVALVCSIPFNWVATGRFEPWDQLDFLGAVR